MRNLINRLLVKLGLREPLLHPKPWRGAKPGEYENIGWTWTSGYGRIYTDDLVTRGATNNVERSKEHEQT